MHIPKPFKNPYYTKNQTRRTQTLKTLLAREKERDKAVRVERKEQKLAEKQAHDEEGDKMEIDEGAVGRMKKDKDGKEGKELDKDDSDWECDPEDLPSCKYHLYLLSIFHS